MLSFIYIYEAASIPLSLSDSSSTKPDWILTFFHSIQFEDSENVNPLT